MSEMFLQIAVTVSPVVRGQSNPEVFLEPKRAGQVTVGGIGRLTIHSGWEKAPKGSNKASGQDNRSRVVQLSGSHRKNNDSRDQSEH